MTVLLLPSRDLWSHLWDVGELKYFPSPSEGGVSVELLEAHSTLMTQGDATTGMEDLSAWPGAGVCSSEIPLH